MLKKLKPKSEFTKNVLTLMTGSTVAQAIPIAISPILTRLYTPEDFGVFALYMSVVSIAVMFGTAKYEMAIVLPKKDKDAINILILSMLISILVCLVLFAFVYIFNKQITEFLGNEKISSLLYLIPISVLFTGFYQSLRYWNNRKKYFKNLAVNSVLQTGAGSSLNLGFGFFGFGSFGLISAGILSQIVSTIFLGRTTWKKDKHFLIYKNKIKIFALMKKYKKLPLLTLPNALVDTIKISGINILISKYFSTASLGQYSIAWRMVVTPASLIGNALSQVFFQKLASSKKHELFSLLIRFIIKATLISLPIYIVVYFYAIDIFTFVFGEKWSIAGSVASALAPWLFLNFISSPISSLYIILNRQEVMLVISIFYMLLPLGVLYNLQASPFIYVIQIMSLSMSVVLIFLIGFIIYLTSKYKRENI